LIIFKGAADMHCSFKNVLTLGAMVLGLSMWAFADQSIIEPGTNENSGARVRVFSSESGGAYLGVDVHDVTTDMVSKLKLKDERGAEVEMVDQDAPAGKAGLKEHDVIVSFNGEPVQSVESLHRMIRETPAGRAVALGISRDGQPMTINVKLADRAKAFNYSYKVQAMAPQVRAMPDMPEMPDMPDLPDVVIPNIQVFSVSARRAGLLVENLTPQLGEFLGVKNGEGVLVKSVEKGSAAATAGFRAGDVIVRVDKDRIGNSSDWSMALRNHASGKVSVGVIRDKHEQVIPLTVPSRKARPNESEYFQYEMPEFLETPEMHFSQQQMIEWKKAEADLRKHMADLKRIDMAKIQPEINKAMRDLQQQMRELQRQKGTL
jgi:serine protease Do